MVRRGPRSSTSPQDPVDGSVGQRQRLLPRWRHQGRVRPDDPGTSYASVSDYGLYRRLAGQSTYTRIYSINTPGAAQTSSLSRIEFDATDLGGKTRIYLGDATFYNNSVAGFFRTERRDRTDGQLDDAQQPEQVLDRL